MKTEKTMASAQATWREAYLAPLWESPNSHNPSAPKPEIAHIWHWSELWPLIEDAIDLVSPADVERRVLVFNNPNSPASRATMKVISAAVQTLLPGESARPHRHSMNALRFVMEGSNAVTRVDGKDCLMNRGDLILTPGWCWHEHVHHGDAPIVWLDALDVPLHRYLGTVAFEPGPVYDLPDLTQDVAFSTPGVMPEMAGELPSHSPLFRYPYEQALAALKAAPYSRDGARRIRYINPATGDIAMNMIDSYLMELEPSARTRPYRSTSSTICTVVEGHGETTVGDQVIRWGPKDVFTLPQGNWIEHRAVKGTARLFQISDCDVYRKLGLLKDEYTEPFDSGVNS